LEIIELNYPVSNASILAQTEASIEKIKQAGKTPRLLFFDAVSSWPGVLFPWKEVVDLCKQHGILSLVDAAHAIGQIPLNLGETQPDFFVTNCHKWLYAHRSCSVLFVNKKCTSFVGLRRQTDIRARAQQLVQSVPTNASYVRKGATYQPNDAFSTESAFVTSFEWLGTMDISNFLSTDVAIDFRKWLGGEEKIMSYAHKVAKEGGRAMAKILGTETMEVQDEQEQTDLIACMVSREARGEADVDGSSGQCQDT
jgi:selenocysteine lyase/cysteine desulfurase